MQISKTRPPKQMIVKQDQLHLILRPYSVGDTIELLEATRESLKSLRAFFSWAALSPQNEAAKFAYVSKAQEAYWSGRDHTMAIFDGETQKFCGSIGLHPSPFNQRVREIGYWLRQSQEGKGIMTLSAKAIVFLGFKFFDLDAIYCNANENNPKSLRVIEKLGFRQVGALPYYEPPKNALNSWPGSKLGEHLLMHVILRQDFRKLNWRRQVESQVEITPWNDLNC